MNRNINLVNLTGRQINIADYEGHILATVPKDHDPRQARPGLEFESSDNWRDELMSFDGHNFVVEIRDVAISHIRRLPEPEEGTYYIVGTSTAIASSYLFDREDVITPDLGNSAMRDSNNRVLAVRRFMRYVDAVEAPAGGLYEGMGSGKEA